MNARLWPWMVRYWTSIGFGMVLLDSGASVDCNENTFLMRPVPRRHGRKPAFRSRISSAPAECAAAGVVRQASYTPAKACTPLPLQQQVCASSPRALGNLAAGGGGRNGGYASPPSCLTPRTAVG